MTKAAELAKMGEVLTNSQIGGRRNIVINGAAQCWQRATSASSIGYTSVDRWSYYAPSSLAISRVTDVPTEFQYAISIGGGGDSSGITQKIEASTCKQLVGATITVSFYLKQTTGAGTDKIAVALSRADSEDNFGGTTSISTQTISTTSSYARYTCTFASLPTEVANGLQLTIKSNGSGSVVYLITGIQLEVGSQATPFEHRSFGEEEKLCRRFYQRTGGTAYYPWSLVAGQNSTLSRSIQPLITPMRATPSFSTEGTHLVEGTSSQTVSSTSIDIATPTTVMVNVNSSSGHGEDGSAGRWLAHNTTGAYIIFDAEL